jgi:hypothetical protein
MESVAFINKNSLLNNNNFSLYEKPNLKVTNIMRELKTNIQIDLKHIKFFTFTTKKKALN